MFRIAICDDNVSDLSNVISIINDYIALQRDKYQIEYTAFHSSLELVTAMENGQQYDLLLLDILMPYLTGMDAAKEIRQFNQSAIIIFMTSSAEYAVESYSVGAYYYALKPIWKDKLIILLDKVISVLEIQTASSLLVKSQKSLVKIFINRLEFAEVIGRTIHYHLADGSVVEAVGSMSTLERQLLSNPHFIKPHRSYIVNMEHIDTLNKKDIKMQSLALVPLARASYSDVKSAYITFAFNRTKTYGNF